ncbi:hypothetical protein MLD38_039962 [Melastoma candidum]|uniref:Uncharacterized protein n=1 Tax=Melastoma candidum TaxID=119954 RepID=A0ACB9L4H5_9MYRT|nr:hypothetical protein MLD38_039962 [Melastoma candidum]
MQTLLCDMLLRDVPLGIMTQSPSIIDLMKCDGAAMCYEDRCWLLGLAPTESQVKELAEWLIHSTGLCTDTLAEIGYPGAVSLAICGMATATFKPNCTLFWFRSHNAKEVKWGGAKHHPEDKDDGGRMHPRSSFKAFVEVAKSRSLPWEVSEINAVHSLQLILRYSMMDMDLRSSKALTCARPVDLETQGLDEISLVACEMVRLIEVAFVPIFGVDSSGYINGWNAKTAELTGLSRDKAMGKSLADEVIHQESQQAFETLLC